MISLPPLVLFNSYSCPSEYIEAVYAFFKADFIDNKVFHVGKVIVCYPDPIEEGKEATFWHIVTKDARGHGRPLDTKRSERIRWPKPVIEYSNDESVKIWEEVKKNTKGKKQTRVHFCFGDEEYLVVLTKRPNHLIFCTAYPILEDDYKYKEELKLRYEESLKKQTPPF